VVAEDPAVAETAPFSEKQELIIRTAYRVMAEHGVDRVSSV
jgi:hypothetical protein